MSATIDNRVVEMQFDNKQFEKNVDTSLNTLERLKAALTFDKESKSLNDLASTGKRFNLDCIANSVDELSNRFNALGIIGITALQRITNQAIDTGKRLVESLTMDQVNAGFSKYEQKTEAVQTIMHATGKSIDEVNEVLTKLNKYTDETSYNFTEMSRTIGKFTGAGVDLDRSEAAMEGIANWAATAGVSSARSGAAFYNLAQAVSSGALKLQDWKSIENLNMATKEFKETAIETALAEGTLVKVGNEYRATTGKNTFSLEQFNSELSTGWLNSEVLLKTLEKFADQTTEFGLNAYHAAQEAKTFTDAIEAVKDALSTGWMQTFETIFGNYEEAKVLWTDLANKVIEFFEEGMEKRNSLFEEWKGLGGRGYLITGLWNALYSLMYLIDTIKDSFHSIFPEITAKRLLEITKSFKSFTQNLMLTDEGASRLKTILSGVFSIIHIGIQFITSLIAGFQGILYVFSPITDAIKHLINNFAYLIITYDRTGEANEIFIDSIRSFIGFISKHFGKAIQTVANWIDYIALLITRKRLDVQKSGGFFRPISDSAEELSSKLHPISLLLEGVKKLINGIVKIFSSIGPGIISVLGILGKAFDTMVNSMVKAFKNADFNTVLNIIKTGLIAGLAIGLKNLVDKISDPIKSLRGLVTGITDVLGSMSDAFSSFTDKIKVGLLLKIAIAIGILAVSLVTLSGIDPISLTAALTALTVMLGELFGMLALISKYLDSKNFKGANKIATVMIGMSLSVLILASAIKKLSSIPVEDIGKSLLAITTLLGELFLVAAGLSKYGGKIKTSGLSMVLFAEAINVLATAVKKLSEIPSDQIYQGLNSLTSILIEMAGFLVVAKYGKLGVSTGLGLIAFAASLIILARAVKTFGEIPSDEVTNGLFAIAFALAALVVALNNIPATIPLIGIGLILVGTSLNVMAKALNNFGSMSISEIAKSLIMLGGSIGVLAVGLRWMTGIASGALAFIALSFGLSMLVPQLISLGKMSMEEIGHSLLTLAGAFVLLGVAGTVLAPIAPAILLLSGALLLFSISIGIVSAALLALTAAISTMSLAFPTVLSIITSLVPTIIESIGRGIIALVNLVSDSATQIAVGVAKIVVAISTALASSAPVLIENILKTLDQILEALLRYVPRMVQAGALLIAGILNGIANNIQGIVESAIDVVVNFIEGVALKLPDVIQAGFDLIISFIDGLSNAIEANTPRLVAAINHLFEVVIKAAIEAIRGSVSQFVQAGKDAVDGLKNGIMSGISSVKNAAIALGNKVLNTLADVVGWHSPWWMTYLMGLDGPEGLGNGIEDNTPYAVDKAKDSARQVINAYESELSRGQSELDDKYGYRQFVGKYDPDAAGNKRINSQRNKKKAEETRENNALEESAKNAADATDNLTESLAGKGGKGGGGAAKGADTAAKETKKLFDVMKDGGKVVEKFAINFGNTYNQLGKTHPIEVGQEAIQKFAETLYEATLKDKDAAEIAALTTEDRLAGMREAWVKFNEDIKSAIDGQTDIWGKLTQKTTITTKEWSKNLKSQRVQLKEWADDLKKLARRGVSEGFIKELVNMGPEMDYQIKVLLASPKAQLDDLIDQISKYPETTEDVLSEVVAAVAAASTGIIGESNVLSEKVNTNFQQMRDDITKAFEEGSISAEELEQKLKELEDKQKEYSDATEIAMEKAKLSYIELRDAVKSAVESQLDLFEKFDDESDLTGDDLLENMKSQIHGVQNWSDDLQTLLGRGLEDGLYQKLAEMGPKSYKYVKAFLEMTSSELELANSYFTQSLTLPSDVAQSLGNDFAVAGLAVSEGFKNGIDPTAGMAEMKTMAQNVVNTFRGELDIHSPSGVTQELGRFTAEGLKVGIENNTFQPVGSAIKMANELLTRLKASMPESDYENIGRYIAEGLARGITNNAHTAISAAVKMAADAYKSACAEVGVESPSKAFAEMGRFCDMGLALGFKNNADEVEEASESVAAKAYNSMRAIVDHITDIINGEVQIDPTIRPVLDTSLLANGASHISSMFGGTSYQLSRGINIQNGRDSLREMINEAIESTLQARDPAISSPINMYVYAAQGQDEEEIANIVEQKLMFRINRLGAVWG